MINIYRDKVKYERARFENDTNTFVFDPPVMIDALILKGHYSVTHSESGDSVSSTLVIRTPEKLVKHSKLDGREVMDSVRVDSIIQGAGYLNYLK